MNAPIPDGEAERLRVLNLYQILDSVSDAAIDDLTRLAAVICDVPIALVSLVDGARQWFLSRVGLTATETPRDQAFCAHAILTPETLIVEDATQDERFAENPLVHDAPCIRFYAGAPLEVGNGVRLGTLCVIDRKPRRLEQRQVDALGVLRDAVVTQLDLRRARRELEAVEHFLPLCAWCRSVRVGEGDDTSWLSLEEYVAKTARISHGMCPGCAESAIEDDA